jgi:peptidoglycan/xylan/chitin deacetylase (PgdA/CDA1 family)
MAPIEASSAPEEEITMARNGTTRGTLLAAVMGLLAVAATGCGDASEPTAAESDLTAGERPPQFVLLAFDGSKSLSFWEESRAFAQAYPVKFTYFISGVYFVDQDHRSAYQAPRRSAGRSDIGFGGTIEEVSARIDQLNLAYQEGHEIASHANGHYDGSQWSQDEWTQEFNEFDKLVFHPSENNGAQLPELAFDVSAVTGFRAPLLGYSSGMNPALAARGFTYDTSRTSSVDYWPSRTGGIWNFPLAQLRIAGTGKRTLSMDYNFYVAQSAGQSDSANKELYQQQMVDTYMAYFETNYFGNRAPINIGHHFSKWNGGAYWEAMKIFASRVCGLPEVKCVTYQELAEFLDENESLISGFRSGSFPKMARPPGEEGETMPIEEPIPDSELEENGLTLEHTESHDDE